MPNQVGVGRGGSLFSTNGLAMGVKFEGAAAYNGKSTHILMIIHARLLHKVVIHNLKNCTQFEKRKWLGNIHEKSSRCLLRNLYYNAYSHLISFCIRMSTS